MSMHQFLHEISLMLYRVFHSDAKTTYGSIALLVISLMFLLVGISRWVEFLDFPFSKLRRNVLIVIHLAGCVVLGLAFALEAVDLDKRFNAIGMGLLASALVLLFPAHIYIGLLRRIRTKNSLSNQ